METVDQQAQQRDSDEKQLKEPEQGAKEEPAAQSAPGKESKSPIESADKPSQNGQEEQKKDTENKEKSEVKSKDPPSSSAQNQEQKEHIGSEPKLEQTQDKDQEEKKEESKEEAKEPAAVSEPTESELNLKYEEWVQKVEALKQNGNNEYKVNEFSRAYLQYHDAIQTIFKFYQTYPQCKNLEVRNKLQELRVNCQNNACQCCLKLGRYSDAILIADEVIRNNPLSAKAMFRKGEALMHQGEFKESMKCLTSAAKLAPNDALIRKTLEQAKQMKAEYESKEKLMYQQAMQEPVAKQEEGVAATASSSLGATLGIVLGFLGLSATAYFAYYKFKKN